jgi:hypothetical protein
MGNELPPDTGVAAATLVESRKRELFESVDCVLNV